MRTLERLRRSARPLARIGCLSIGTVYVVVGVLALFALAGVLIEAADEDRMVHVLLDLPGGGVLVAMIVAGLAGYVGWRAVEVITDPYGFGNDLRGLATRVMIALSALAYGFLAYSVAGIALTGGGGALDDAEGQQQAFVGRVLEWPAGEWLVAIAGFILIVVAAGQVMVLVRGAYTIEIDLRDRSPFVQRLTHALAWYGYGARSVILAVLGYFLVRAGVRSDPQDAGDTDTAFDYIGGGRAGDLAFFLVAVGTIAYGVFMYLNARFYKFGTVQGRRLASKSGT